MIKKSGLKQNILQLKVENASLQAPLCLKYFNSDYFCRI